MKTTPPLTANLGCRGPATPSNPDFKMSSSIHTIHRTVETNNQAGVAPHLAPDYFSRRHHSAAKPRWTPRVVLEEDGTASDGDEEADFEVERNSPDEMDSATILEIPPNAKGEDKGKRVSNHDGEGTSTPVRSPSPKRIAALASVNPGTGAAGGSIVLRAPNHRSMSIATVRLKRRTKLASKLREVFGVEGITEVVAGEWDWCLVPCGAVCPQATLFHGLALMQTPLSPSVIFTELPCWLLRSICAFLPNLPFARLLTNE